jgi:hypothetical protein
MTTSDIVKAGHRFFGMAYLILAEDGADPGNDDPELPRDVLRVTIATGRQLDLRDPAADEFRRSLVESARPPSAVTYVHGQHVSGSACSVVSPPAGRRRKAK